MGKESILSARTTLPLDDIGITSISEEVDEADQFRQSLITQHQEIIIDIIAFKITDPILVPIKQIIEKGIWSPEIEEEMFEKLLIIKIIISM